MRLLIGAALILLAQESQAFGWFGLDWLHFGQCPTNLAQPNFNISAYSGLWYLQLFVGPNVFHDQAGCGHGTYNYVNDASMTVSMSEMLPRYNKTVMTNGTAVCEDPSQKGGYFALILKESLFWWNYKSYISLVFFKTDYKDYSIIYSCENHFFIFHSWVVEAYSRKEKLNADEMENFRAIVNETLINHNISPTTLTATDRSNCD